MIHLPPAASISTVHRVRAHLPPAAVICLALLIGTGHAAPDSIGKPRPAPPEVLVLVFSGLGPFDQVAINYSTVVSGRQTKDDISEIRRVTGWPVRNPEATTQKDSTPGAKPATSSRFEVPSIVNKAEGTLPLEPFVSALKRFRSMQVIYLIPGEFRFRGLKDFENDYVKIHFRRQEGTYTYDVRVKNPGFDRLQLPLKEEGQTGAQQIGMSAAARFLVILAVAIAGGALVYFVASRFSKGTGR